MNLQDFIDYIYTSFYGVAGSNVINSVYTMWGITNRSELTFFQDLAINLYCALPYIIVFSVILCLLFVILRLFIRIFRF